MWDSHRSWGEWLWTINFNSVRQQGSLSSRLRYSDAGGNATVRVIERNGAVRLSSGPMSGRKNRPAIWCPSQKRNLVEST